MPAKSGDTFRQPDRIRAIEPAEPDFAGQAGKISALTTILRDPEAAAKIDAWIKEVTKGAIPEILGSPLAKCSRFGTRRPDAGTRRPRPRQKHAMPPPPRLRT